MLAGTVTASLSDMQTALLEKVRMDPIQLYSVFEGITKRIGGMKRVEKVNTRAYQIHQQKYPGGVWQVVDRDGGSLGVGSGPSAAKMSGGFYYHTFGVELTDKLMFQTDTQGGGSANGGAVINAFKQSVGNAMQTIVRHLDRYFFGDGTGLLTENGSATGSWASGSTYTFAGASDYRGVSHLLEGMAVEVWPTALGAKRANATNAGYPFIIDSIDWQTKVVNLIGTVTGAVSTDRLAVVGIASPANAGPNGTFGAGWPFSDDVFIHGIPYANDTNTAHYYLSVLRSTRPNINARKFDAGGTVFFNSLMTQSIRDQLLDSRGTEALSGLMGICHMAQRVQVQATGASITNFPRQGVQDVVDILPRSGSDGLKPFEWGEVEHIILPQQFKNKIDYLNFDMWERIEDFPGPRPLKTEGSNGFGFRKVDVVTGGQKSIMQWIWEASLDYCCVDPGRQGTIINLPVPSGY